MNIDHIRENPPNPRHPRSFYKSAFYPRKLLLAVLLNILR